MMFLIIFLFNLAIAFGLPGKQIISSNIVVPVGGLEGRISHGNHADEQQFPYQAGITLYNYDGSTSWCGGTLISHTDIITAAHCTEDILKIGVLLGSTDRQFAEYFYEVTPDNIFFHPDWDYTTTANDISMVKIPYTKYSTYIQPAKLPARDIAYSSFAGENAIASGWGCIPDSYTDHSTNLQYAIFNVVSNNDCNSFFPIPILATQLCVSSYQALICNGDSGGPLVLQDSNILIGISSFGCKENCEQNQKIIFTRVTSFLDWIAQHGDISLEINL